MVSMDVDGASCGDASERNGVPSPSPSPSPSKEFDELRYSRLIYTLGRDAVHSLSHCKVLILGCKGVGAEIAKNLVLSGIGGLGLVDDEVVSTADLGSQFLLAEADVGRRSRAEASAKKIKEMHPLVDIVPIPALGLERALGGFHGFVATTGSKPYLVEINLRCRAAGIPFVYAQSRGVFSMVFADFGDKFSILDETGVPSGALLVESITQDYPATVTVVEEQRHGLEDGDQVVFSGVRGMVELNRPEMRYAVTVTGASSFTIIEDTRSFGQYVSGGYCYKVKREKVMEFLPLEKALLAPKFCVSDPVKSVRLPHVHVAFQAIGEYERRAVGGGTSTSNGVGSRGTSENGEVEEVLGLARDIWAQLGLQGRERVVYSSGGSGSFRMEEIAEVVGNGEENRSSTQSRVGDGFMRGRGGGVGDDEACGSMGEDNGRADIKAGGSLDEDLVKKVFEGAHVELSPVCAVTGGIAAQEVIKAISGVFVPLNQWLYYDAVECLPTVAPSPEETQGCGSRYDSQVALFGKKFQDVLGGLRWLVVGAGGLGSEVLKNLVMMGVGCGMSGNITVTDMDCVSRPNLVDQLLYQLEDVNQPKSLTAARALRNINPAAKIHALLETFDGDTENIFDSSFFRSISGVFSTVDTSEARVYIDSRCVVHGKPMIDGGKHGTKGSVQVFVPFQSEMYASTRDPPEHREVPICTLKNFPYATDHTLRWAVDAFETLFKKRPLDVNAYLSSRDFQDSIRKSPPAARLPILETLRDALLRHRPLSFEACVHWARLQFEDLFANSIKQLCFNFPPDMTTTAGGPFWSGTKRSPSPVSFDPLNSLHLDFIVSAANLQATVYGLKGCQDRAVFLDILQTITVPTFAPKEGVKISTSPNEVPGMVSPGISSREDYSVAIESCEHILQELPTPASLAGYRLTPIEFHKDDESHYHVEFVASAASLRAWNYGIPHSDKLQARLIGGKVIPAIVTSTAVVGGLMCLEMYKVLQSKPLADYKHSYLNLAVPFFSFAQPVKAVEHTVARRDGAPLSWTLWDRFELDCVGMSLEAFLAEFKRQQGLEITMISHGKSLLYAEFLPRKKLQDRLPLPLLELISVIGKVTLPATESTVTFSINCTDVNDDDVDVPDVVARVR